MRLGALTCLRQGLSQIFTTQGAKAHTVIAELVEPFTTLVSDSVSANVFSMSAFADVTMLLSEHFIHFL